MNVKQFREELKGLDDCVEVKISVLGKVADAHGVDWLWDGEKGWIEIHDFKEDDGNSTQKT